MIKGAAILVREGVREIGQTGIPGTADGADGGELGRDANVYVSSGGPRHEPH